ncbi:hypothetical protein ACTFIZ_002652 [Dictyostelium cf. discoideum]
MYFLIYIGEDSEGLLKIFFVDGSNGKCGEAGTGAGSIDLKLTTNNDDTVFVNHTLEPTSQSCGSQGIQYFMLGDPSSTLYLSSRGGDGGNGGDGSDGRRGYTGCNGMNATRFSSGTNGGNGGDGGKGGDGGHGGYSGNGNNITIRCNQEDTDLLMVLKQKVSVTSSGIAGKGGNKGGGGSGGSGGCGGFSYSWTEYRSVSDGRGGTRTETSYHTSPGGFPGFSGSKGDDGENGIDGKKGVDGKYIIQVLDNDDIKFYNSPYNLMVEDIEYIDRIGYNVIEPDSNVTLMVKHKNAGGMPTPSHHNIMAYVSDNGWVFCHPENRVAMERSILEGSSSSLNKRIEFKITDFKQNPNALPCDPFKVNATMDHQCLVDRINQSFKTVSDNKSNFIIEYPIQTSLIKGLNSVILGEEAPFVFSILNKSLLNIGEKANSIQSPVSPMPSPNRVLYTTLRVHTKTCPGSGNSSINPETDIIVRDKHGVIFSNPENGLYSHIEMIGPSELKFFSGTISFINPDIKPYTKILLESTIYLGHVSNMMSPLPIQSRPFEIQLSEGYLPRSTFQYDLLLVVNNQSEYIEIKSWRKLAKSLNLKLNIWNTSLYRAFNLSHVKMDGKSLLEDFRGKTIIYLNNTFLKDEQLISHSYLIKPDEFFNAAYNHGIKFLIIGKSYSIEREITPLNTLEKSTTQVNYLDEDHFFKTMKFQIPLSVKYQTTHYQPSMIKDQVILSKIDSGVVHLNNDSPIIETRTIPTIQVVHRYVFTKPTIDHLRIYAEKLSNKLMSRFPNQRNVVVYDFNPKPKSGWHMHTLGNVEIHRSLDRTDSHIIKLDIENDNTIKNPKTIQSPTVLYHLFKSLDFRTKLIKLDEIVETLSFELIKDSNISTTTKLGLLILSICSDLAEEQYHFRFSSNWRDQLPVEAIKSNLLKLNILKNFKFKNYINNNSNNNYNNNNNSYQNNNISPIDEAQYSLLNNNSDNKIIIEEQYLRPKSILSNLIIEIGAHLENMMLNFSKGFFDKILFFRRTGDVNNATKSIWDEIIHIHLMGFTIQDNKIVSDKSNVYNDKEVKKQLLLQIKKIQESKLASFFAYIKGIQNEKWGYSFVFDKQQKREIIISKKETVISSYRTPPFNTFHSTIDSQISLPNVMKKEDFMKRFVKSNPNQTFEVIEGKTNFENKNYLREEYIDNIIVNQLNRLPESVTSCQLKVQQYDTPIFNNSDALSNIESMDTHANEQLNFFLDNQSEQDTTSFEEQEQQKQQEKQEKQKKKLIR